MKKIGMLAKSFYVRLWILAVLALPAASASATYNLYVSPSGSDSNDCSSATLACKTPNQAVVNMLGRTISDNVIVNFDVGTYFSPPYASDGGAPDVANGKALIDLEGLTIGPYGSLTLLGSTQQINPPGLVVGAIDAGSLTVPGSVKYEGWVQIAIDGGWSTTGGYANDAGLCYMDGGVCVLGTNALVGDFIQFTTGAGLITAPIVSNTTGAGATTINYVIHSNTTSAPTAPTAASKFNVFSLASHLKPFPSDGGYATSYSQTNTRIGFAGAYNATVYPYSALYAANGNITQNPLVTLQYLDISGAPAGANSDFDVVDLMSTPLVDFVNDNIAMNSADDGLTTYNGSFAADGCYISGNGQALTLNAGSAWLTGNFFNNVGMALWSVRGASAWEANVVFAHGAPANNPVFLLDVNSWSAMHGLFIDQGSSQKAAITQQHGSNTVINGVQEISDGGAGLINCGAGGLTALLVSALPDAGFNEISTDNGVTYITQTTRLAQDGGTAGVNAFCNQGTGCCYTSY